MAIIRVHGWAVDGGNVAEDGTFRDDPKVARAEPMEGGVPAIDSRTLLKGGKELVIRHAGENYRLQVTRQNRLILNK